MSDQSPAQPVIPIPAFIYNHDVIGLANRIGRFIIEAVRSNSSNLATVTAADQARLASYLDNVDSYQAHIVGAPALDLPETSHSIKWPVEPLDPVPAMNNEAMEDMVRLMSVQHAELLNSDSCNASSGLSVFDAARLTAITAKARDLLTKYIATSTPIDLPASGPMDPVTPVAR